MLAPDSAARGLPTLLSGAVRTVDILLGMLPTGARDFLCPKKETELPLDFIWRRPDMERFARLETSPKK